MNNIVVLATEDGIDSKERLAFLVTLILQLFCKIVKFNACCIIKALIWYFDIKYLDILTPDEHKFDLG